MSDQQPEAEFEKLTHHHGRDLTTGSIPRHLIAFSLPMLVGSLLQTAYSFVNAIWVGRYIGKEALAAVTVSLPAVFVLVALAAGLTLSTNILVSQYVGAREYRQVRRVVQTSVVLVLGLSLLLCALGEYFSADLLRLMQTPPDVYHLALPYLRIFLLSLPLSFAIFLIASLLRGTGDSKTPLYFQAVSVVINAVLDPILIFGAFGFPKLGLDGTAWATLIAQSVAVVALFVLIPRLQPLVAPDCLRLRVDLVVARLLVVIGLPAMIQQSMVSMSLLAVVHYVSVYGGTNADAAFGAAIRIDQVAFLPAMTLGMAVSTLTGQNIGAGKVHRVSEVFWWGLLLSGGISLVISLAAMAYPQYFLRIFINDPHVIAIGSDYLRVVSFTYVLYAVMFISNGVINGAGHTFATTLITVAALLLIRIPLAKYLPVYLYQGSVRGIWVAMLLSVGMGMILSLLYYASRRWQQAVIKSAPAGA
ncbi:MAG: MATE family efflux transporter [Armatimonadota bacterium]